MLFDFHRKIEGHEPLSYMTRNLNRRVNKNTLNWTKKTSVLHEKVYQRLCVLRTLKYLHKYSGSVLLSSNSKCPDFQLTGLIWKWLASEKGSFGQYLTGGKGYHWTRPTSNQPSFSWKNLDEIRKTYGRSSRLSTKYALINHSEIRLCVPNINCTWFHQSFIQTLFIPLIKLLGLWCHFLIWALQNNLWF